MATRLERDDIILRPWRDADRAPFAEMSADPAVMEFLGPPQSRAESDAGVDRVMAHFDAHGFGFWALEVKNRLAFAGFVGLKHINFEAPFAPAVEIGWRLAPALWGQGYATRAARLALDYGFNDLGLNEIVAITVPDNNRSQAVMSRLGMTRDMAGDFEHPNLPEGSPFRPHVLYRLRRP